MNTMSTMSQLHLTLKISSSWASCSPFLPHGSSSSFQWPVVGTTMKGEVPWGKKSREQLAFLASLQSGLVYNYINLSYTIQCYTQDFLPWAKL